MPHTHNTAASASAWQSLRRRGDSPSATASSPATASFRRGRGLLE